MPVTDGKVARVDANGVLKEWGYIKHPNAHAKEFPVPRDFYLDVERWRTHDDGATWTAVESLHMVDRTLHPEVQPLPVGFIRRWFRRVW